MGTQLQERGGLARHSCNGFELSSLFDRCLLAFRTPSTFPDNGRLAICCVCTGGIATGDIASKWEGIVRSRIHTMLALQVRASSLKSICNALRILARTLAGGQIVANT